MVSISTITPRKGKHLGYACSSNLKGKCTMTTINETTNGNSAERTRKVSKKPVRKFLSVANLTVNDDNSYIGITNVRQLNNYDVPAMMEDIALKGRITNPIIAEKVGEKYIVLQGNRRTKGGQAWLAKADCPADLKTSLEKTECEVYENLTEDERLSLIYDHGGQKDIARVEVALAVWQMVDRFYSPSQVAQAMYYNLAKFTRNDKLLHEVQAITDPKQRAKRITDWFRGTLDGYILAAQKMGPYIRQQFLLTLKGEQNLLLPDEKVELNCSSKRIVELKKAMNADAKDNKWNATEGHGPEFDKLVDKYKAEDAGTLEVEKSTRPTVSQLEETAARFRSAPVKNALLLAAGKREFAASLPELDEQLYLLNMKLEIVSKFMNDVADSNVKALLGSMIFGTPAAVEESLKPFLKAPVTATVPA